MASKRYYAKTLWLVLPLVAGCAAQTQLSSQGAGTNSGDKARFASVLGGNNREATTSDANIERIAAVLDNPQQIYDKASYEQLWTADNGKVTSRLPQGLKTVPHEARVWEDWFRKHLTNDGKQLNTADLLTVNKTVMETVANDPKCQFQAPSQIQDVARHVENARAAALKSFGINQPSSALVQMTRLDAVTAFVKGQWDYGRALQTSDALTRIEDSTTNQRYPTANEMLASDYRLNCARSDLLAMYIVREIEKSRPTGLMVGSVYIFAYNNDGRMDLHGNMVGKIALPGNQFAHLYYDPTAIRKGAMKSVDRKTLSRDAGPLDEASIERYVNRNCIAVYPKEKYPHPVDYVNILNEKWPEFGIGNWDSKAFLSTDYISWRDQQPCKAPFEAYVRNNLPKIASLDKAVDDAYSGRL